jgi:hypothetical protein
METLKIKTLDKNLAIKEINKFRLKNKNKWFQIELTYFEYVYRMKIFNTWVQLNYQYQNDKLNFNNPSVMDLNVKNFKNYLSESIKN